MAKAQGIRAGKAYVELGVSDRLTAGLKRAQKRLSAFGAGLRSLGKNMLAVSGAVGAPLVAAIGKFTSVGDQFDKMSKRTGVSVEALSELQFAAEQSGSNVESLEKGLRRMAGVVDDAGRGMATAEDALAGVGLSAAALAGLTPEEQFKAIANGLDGVTDASKKAALAQDIFGRAGAELIPMMAGGAAGIEALQQQARDLGLTISTETAADAAELTDAINILRKTVRAVAIAVGSAFAKSLTAIVTRVAKVATRIGAWVKANQALMLTVGKVVAVIGGVGAALVAAGALISGLGAALGGLVPVVTALGGVLAAIVSPIGPVVAGLAGLAVAAVQYTTAGGAAVEWMGDKFTGLLRSVGTVIGGIKDALAGGDVQLAAKVLFAGLRVAFESGMLPVRRAWNTAWGGIRLAAIEVWSAIQGAWLAFRQYMESTFPNLTASITRAWSAMVLALRSAWAKFQNWLTEQVVKVWGFFDESVDVEGVLKLNDDDLRDQLDAIEKKYTDAVAEANRKQQRSPEERAAEQALERATAEAERLAAQQRVIESMAANAGTESDALTATLEEYHAALAAAKEASANAAGLPGRSGEHGDIADRIASALAGVEQRQQQISSAGTFSGFSVRGLDTSLQGRIARATEETASNTEKLLDKARQGGLKFDA